MGGVRVSIINIERKNLSNHKRGRGARGRKWPWGELIGPKGAISLIKGGRDHHGV